MLVVDEWVETGTQVLAAISLIERLGGVVIGVVSINIDEAANAKRTKQGYPCFSVAKANA